MSNLIERLRSAKTFTPSQFELARTANEAADVMTAMLAALERLIAAYSVSHSPAVRESVWEQARAAIKAAKGEA
jgi:hypothetical protein